MIMSTQSAQDAANGRSMISVRRHWRAVSPHNTVHADPRRSPPGSARRGRSHQVWLACLAFAGLVLAGCREPAPEDSERPAASVSAERVGPADFGEVLSISGSVTAERQVQLSPRVDGLVSQVHVDAGDRVETGQGLLDLDPDVSRQVLERARAQLEQATAVRREAGRQLAIARGLGEKSVIARSQVEARESDLAIAQAAEGSARATVREQEELVSRHHLPAPFSGVITERLTDSGAWVALGTSVLGLVATDRVRLDLHVPQERYGQIGDGAHIRVYSEALGRTALPARVAAKVPVVDARARTFLLRLLINDPDARLLPGMSARAEISMPPMEGLFAVHRDALLRQADGGHSLFVIEQADGISVARRRTVRALYGQGDQVAVSGNLRIGDHVVVRGNEALEDGQSAAIARAAAGGAAAGGAAAGGAAAGGELPR
ncbi:efflux RND transporter periplasmic adaptor subunit [Tistrella bauzanensis]